MREGTEPTTLVETYLTALDIAALDGWIARQPEPHPTRGQAVREILAGVLGSHHESTILPGLVTGRDIV